MNKNSTRLIRIDEVMDKVGIAKSTVWYMVKEGTFQSQESYLHVSQFGLNLKLMNS